MVRPSSCCDKLSVRKGAWAEEKDGTEFEYLSKHGTASNWSSAPRKTGTNKRCGKNCRARWNSYLRPDLSLKGFTQHEEELIIKLHAAVGSRWGLIAHQLPGRTENVIKNHWNTKLRKKLSEMGIDPITHKPFSQILADYGNIGGVSRPSSDAPKHIGTIRRDLKKTNTTTTTLPKPDSSTSTPYTTLLSSSLASHQIPSMHRNDNNSNSLDLLSQLKAISIGTEGPNLSTNTASNTDSSYEFLCLPSTKSLTNYSIPTPVSSSSDNDNAGQASKSPDCFSWHDFLLDEELKPGQNQSQEHQESTVTEFLSNNDSAGVDSGKSQAAASPLLASADASSFLEAMLDQENDMFLSFPGLMEDLSY